MDSSVVDLSKKTIPVTITNISGKTKTIKKGEVTATCAPVTRITQNSNRSQESSNNLVKDLLQNTDLDANQRNAAESLFSRRSGDFGRTNMARHRIDTGDHPPIKQHPRRLPFAKQEEGQK